MITPKTDWTANDYFNLDDYERIRSNVSDLALEYGVRLTVPDAEGSLVSIVPPAGSYGMPLTQLIRNEILLLCIRIARARGWHFALAAEVTAEQEEADPWAAVVNVPRWFDWQELNAIERLCELAASDVRSAEYGAGHEYGTGVEYGGAGVG